MIEYRLNNNRALKSALRGEGKIPDPCKIDYLYASGKELEIILRNASFLNESTFGRTNQTFTNCEASAAALAFNYTEIEVKPFIINHAEKYITKE